MKGKVLELVHGERSANVELEDGDTRLFMRLDVRLDTTRKYQEDEEEDLNSQLAGTGLETRKDQELEETRKRPRIARQAPNAEPEVPRRSSRLARKRVTLVDEERSHNPKNLAYYMDAVMEGHAGMWKVGQQYGLEERQEKDEEESPMSHSGLEDRAVSPARET